FSRGLGVCGSDGVEEARLEPLNHWWLPFGGYKVFRGDEIVALVPHLRSASIRSGEGAQTPIAVAESHWIYSFIRELSVVARLNYTGKDPYDLEIARDANVDPLLIVAVSVGIDQVNRAVFTGGGG